MSKATTGDTIGQGAEAGVPRAKVRGVVRWIPMFILALAACSGPSGADPDAGVADDAGSNDASPDDAPACTQDCPCDEGTTRACGSDVGTCRPGVETCTAGVWGSCEGAVEAGPEVCDGALDEDCDGETDEDCTDDPFDAASCGGAPWTQADALARLGMATREVLASATIQVRTRSCPGGTCGPWGAGAPWQTRFLTWSGGVVTRYLNLQADTELVLFEGAGTSGATARLSIQHVTFPAGGYPDTKGMLFDIPTAGPSPYPVFRAYNVMPENQYDYRDLELTLKHGELAIGPRCARFTATVYAATEPYTTEYAALYRW